MRVDPRFLNWGVFFILLGAIPLAVNQGWIPADTLTGWWRYWPLILIGIGVGLLLRRTPVHFLGGLIVAATFGLMFGSILAGGIGGRFDFACSRDQAGPSFAAQGGTLDGNASVSLEMSCGDVHATAASGAGWKLDGRAPEGRPPTVDAAPGRLAIASRDRTGLGFFGAGRPAEAWELSLPTDSTIDLSSTLNAGSARFDLAGARLGDLSLTTNFGSVIVDLGSATVASFSTTVNAGSTRLTLPDASLHGSATVNVGSFEFCVPAGAGLRIDASDSVLGSNNFAQRGLTQEGSTWTTPGFASAAVKIDLSTTANLGSVELDPEGGCK